MMFYIIRVFFASVMRNEFSLPHSGFHHCKIASAMGVHEFGVGVCEGAP